MFPGGASGTPRGKGQQIVAAALRLGVWRRRVARAGRPLHAPVRAAGHGDARGAGRVRGRGRGARGGVPGAARRRGRRETIVLHRKKKVRQSRVPRFAPRGARRRRRVRRGAAQRRGRRVARSGGREMRGSRRGGVRGALAGPGAVG